MSLTLNIKLGPAVAIPVEVSQSDRVHDVKQKIYQKQDIDPDTSRLTILFQGKEMRDDQCLQDSDLCDFSVLHAVMSPTKTKPPASEWTDGAVGLNLFSDITPVNTHLVQAPDGDKPRPRCVMYYVYCKSVCGRVQPGRLRTRCSRCKQGTLRIYREPCGWDDVLKKDQIQGECLNEGCDGNTVEIYFKCSGHKASGEEQDSCVVLYQIVANIHDNPCLTCTEVGSPVLVFKCNLTHVMCLACFEEYCSTRLKDRAFVYSTTHGYTLGCPAGCEESLIEESHHFKVLGPEEYERYQRFATEECLLREGGVMCPAPGCGEGLFPGDVRRVQCVQYSCLFVFCKECHQEYHEGPCTVLSNQSNPNARRFVQQTSQELASLHTIETTTKPCPKCRVPVEKTGGCMHMACSRCSYEWCWLCQTEWTRDCQGDHWFG